MVVRFLGGGSGPLDTEAGESAVGPAAGFVAFANGTGTDDLTVNVSSPAGVGLNMTNNSASFLFLKDFLKRNKKDVDWRKHSVGTVDVRAEMNALDVLHQVLQHFIPFIYFDSNAFIIPHFYVLF